MTSVLQDWVTELPLRAQGTLMTGIRGCDLVPKNPASIDEEHGCSTGECSPERGLSAYFRYCVLNPADPREVDIPGAWFQSNPPEFKPSQFGQYPLHWYSHMMHGFEVIGYCHPDPGIQSRARFIYLRMVRNLHLNAETRDEMMNRLNEDRIATGNVVS